MDRRISAASLLNPRWDGIGGQFQIGLVARTGARFTNFHLHSLHRAVNVSDLVRRAWRNRMLRAPELLCPSEATQRFRSLQTLLTSIDWREQMPRSLSHEEISEQFIQAKVVD